MTDFRKFEQMLEYLIVNEDKAKAEELFHELVVAKSREIYENLLDDDIQVDEFVGGDASDNFLGDVEATDDSGEFGDEEDGEGEFGADDEFGDDEGEFGGEDEGGDSPATKDDILDIKDALEDLKAEFEAMLNGEDTDDSGDEFGADDSEDEFGGEDTDDSGDEFGADDDEEDSTKEGFVREYVEQVGGKTYDKFGKMGDNGVNSKSTVAKPNDMGGTAANIAQGGVESSPVESGKGQLRGSGLLKGTPKDLNSGNVNVPGSKSATKLSNVSGGHGAEKKGAGETSVDAKSIIGSRK